MSENILRAVLDTRSRPKRIGQRRAAVIGALALCGIIGLGSQARASYIVTFSEVGLNVVANGSGSIDTTGLTPAGSFFDPTGFIIPANALEITQPENTGGQEWSGITGPTSFGSGGQTNASSGSGDVVGVAGAGGAVLGLPSGYVSGAPLSSTSTWDNATFASLGLTPGTYVWTWTGGTDDDSYEVVIGAVPEPSPLLLTALGLALTLLAPSAWVEGVPPVEPPLFKLTVGSSELKRPLPHFVEKAAPLAPLSVGAEHSGQR